MTQADLLIIGAGPGGYRAAEHAARHGLKTVVFEAARVGGTCLNEGCIPTKSLARHAELMLTLREAERFGMRHISYDFDYGRVLERKDEVLHALRTGIETLLAHPCVTLVRDRAVFVDGHTVLTASGGETYTAPHIIVATGSEAKVLPGMRDFITHQQLLSARQLPRSLCIVGAGVIGMELASIYQAFGVEVSVVEFLKECLPVLDSDIAKRLRKLLERRGIQFFMQCGVKRIESGTVTYEDKKGVLHTLQADSVLMAVGRKPRLSDDFQKAGFEYNERMGIKVDEHFETTVKGVYAIGDVNGLQMLAHAAEWQARQVVRRIVGLPALSAVEAPVPAAIFTHPEAACVGLSEDQCRAQSIAYECRKAFHRANGKAMAMGETEGMVKLLSDMEGRILGCHAFGAHAADMVQEASVLMSCGATIGQLCEMIHIHPTLGEVLLAAAEASK